MLVEEMPGAKEEEKCEAHPLGWFGNYKKLSGCHWCELAKECKKKTKTKIKRIRRKRR